MFLLRLPAARRCASTVAKVRKIKTAKRKPPILRRVNHLEVNDDMGGVQLPSVEARVAAMIEGELGGVEVLEAIMADGDVLSDAMVSLLVENCLGGMNKAHGAVTFTMFDTLCEEAEQLVATAERLGHEVGPETLCTLISLHANPTPGPARDLRKAVSLLNEYRDPILELIPDPVLPFWLYEHILLGAAYDDDEQTVKELVHSETTPELTPTAWGYAISACNTVETLEDILGVMKGEKTTEHYNAMLKVHLKCKMPPSRVEGLLKEMEDNGVPMDPDTYVMWMACSASTGGGNVRHIYHALVTSIRNEDITVPLVMSILKICLIHAKNADDDYVQLAREVYGGAERVGLTASYEILARTMHIFTNVGHQAFAEELYKESKSRGVRSGMDDHLWEMRKTAFQSSGNIRDSSTMDEDRFNEKGVPYEVQHVKHPGGYKATPNPTVRPHGYARRVESFVKPVELFDKGLPSTPKHF